MYIGYIDADGAKKFETFAEWLARDFDPEESRWTILPSLASLLGWCEQRPLYWMAPRMRPDERKIDGLLRSCTRHDARTAQG